MSSLPRLVRLAMLDSYGVEWSLATFARDVLQNFFDVAASFREIVLDRDDAAGTLEVRGPAEFDLELLAYVGATTKLDGKTAGGFGEGFKICALVGVRDHGLAIRAGSGETELEVAFEPVPLGRELCYRVRDAPGRKGSFVRLEGCTAAVFTAFEAARHQFYHEDNPHLGPLVATDAARTVAVHLAAPGERCGQIYYRRQFRGEIAYHGDRAGPVARLTLACHHLVDSLEGDRDRRILEPERVARAVGDRLPPEGLHRALLQLEGEWPHRHEVMDGLLQAAIDRKLRFDWPDGWLARSPKNDHGLGRLAERAGFKLAVAELGAIGMKIPKDVVRLEKGKVRTPTPAERKRIDVAIALYGALSCDDPPAAREWEIFDATKGEAPHGHHGGRKLFVPSHLLGQDSFAQGTAVALHELAHELGDEDSPAFLNRLARLVGAAIGDPSAVAAARARFERDRPKGRRVPEVPAVDPYKPAFEVRPNDSRRGCYFVNIYVPPGFPPTTALLERIYEATAAVGLPCYPMLTEIWSSADARRLELRGIPSVKFGSTEVDACGASGRPGLRLRTYGPERGVLPSVEMVAGALHAYVAELRAGTAPVQTPEQQLANRDFMARHRCFEWAKATAKGTGREQLEIGLAYACGLHLDAVKKGVEQTYEELSAAVRDDVLRMKQAADAHVAAQTDFDPGDSFEEEALRRAHTVFLAGFAAGGAERAARDFAVVREATKELLAADLGTSMREAVLEWCVDRTGPKEHYLIAPRLEPLDEAAFRAAFTKGLGEARRIQLMLDHEERGLRWGELERRLDSAILTPDEREEARVKKLASIAATGRLLRHHRMRAVLTHTIKETWERTLAETGSEATAGEACIALVRRLENEVAADERRAEKGAA